MSFANERMLMSIPPISEIRKFPLICVQNCLNFPLNRSLTAVILIAFIEPTSSSYIPVMKAIVPPDTPGITSAAPMQIPLTAVMR